jgi:hypothetical protein
MSIEVLHEWEPNQRVREILGLYPLDHIVVGFETSNGQRVRCIRNGDTGNLVKSISILTDARNLYLRCLDAGACEHALDWLVGLPRNLHVDEAFEQCRYAAWLTWWFDRFAPKDEATQIAYFNAGEVYEKAYKAAWENEESEAIIEAVQFALGEFKDAVRDFYLPALRAWTITYDHKKPYIRA